MMGHDVDPDFDSDLDNQATAPSKRRSNTLAAHMRTDVWVSPVPRVSKSFLSLLRRGARATLFVGVLALAVVGGGCQTLAPPDTKASARRIDNALDVLTSGRLPPTRVEATVRDYRRALNDVLPAAVEGGARPSFEPAPPAPPAQPAAEAFAEVTPVKRERITTPELHRAGLGAPSVGRIYPGGPNAPAAGYHQALTAVALPAPGAALQVALADPERVATVDLGARRMPLAMDLDAPLDAARSLGPGIFAGLRYLLRADAFSGQSRVTFLEPYDPAKRPLVLIHGLMTTPRMWDRLARALLADPCIRQHYQIWFFYYPTAQPVPLSALQLRNALDDAVEWHDVSKPMVLVGYSMGGVLARAQLSSLGPAEAERILPGVSELPEDSLVRRALVFEPRQDVSRVVFMLTPHRGSRLATLNIAVWGTRLIRLPDWIRNEMTVAINQVLGLTEGRLPTSIHGLSPGSPFLQELDRRPPAVPAHSIIGNRGRRHDLWRSSDGVVPYSSAHLPSAVSEVVVPAGHGGFDHPQSIDELKRILRLELQSEPDAAAVLASCDSAPAGGAGSIAIAAPAARMGQSPARPGAAPLAASPRTP